MLNAREYVNRLRDAVENSVSLKRVSRWMTQHTTLGGNPFSFKDHEFQEDIADSDHHNTVVIKPSQVGMTELIIRSMLGFLASTSDVVGMYLMPTVKEANHISKSRVDPVIRQSKTLKSMIVAGSDSASFKEIGSSQLVMGGTHGKAVISVPADLLTFDEIDFANRENVITAESRIQHSRFIDERTGLRGIKKKWSTPTAVGVGVDGLYSLSDQRHRLVRCKHCTHWFWPDWLKHCVVDGWDKDFTELTYMDVASLDARGVLHTARLLCPKCHNIIDRANLGPEYRDWVALYPSKLALQGWRVSPFDVPAFHSAESITRKLLDYKNETAHFRNFVLGQAYSDASNSFMEAAVTENTILMPMLPDRPLAVSGTVAGLDVGKISWFIVGKPMGNGVVHVLYAEQIRLRDELSGELVTRVVELLKRFRVYRLVCDSLPYTDSILSIQAARPEGWVLPADYELRDRKLPIYLVNENTNTVSINRTKSFNLASKRVNNGSVKWPHMETEMKVVTNHLKAIKRLDRVLDDGTEESDWVSDGPDHYAHALNYMTVGAQIVESELSLGWAPPATMRKVVIGSRQPLAIPARHR